MADGKVVYEIRADDSKVSSDLNKAEKKVKKAAEKSEQSVKEAADGSAKEIKQASSKAEKGLDNVTTAAKKVDSAIDDIDSEGLDKIKSGSEDASGALDGLLGKLSGVSPSLGSLGGISAPTAIGAGFVAAGSFAVSAASDMQSAMDQFQASTGIAKEELEDYQSLLEDIYSNNYGESFEDVASAMGQVKQQMGNISQEDMRTVVEGLYTLEDTFGADFGETLRGTDQLMTQFGLSAEDAIDLMASGMQNGLNYTDELGDNISEYAGKFSQAGYSAEEYFQLLQNGSEGGSYNLDKVNDAINEVTTRLADGTIEESLGLFDTKTQDTFKAWKNGEATQKDVIDSIVNNIKTCTDEQDALTLASTAFGTMGEDANLQFVKSLNSVGDTFDETSGKMEEIQDIKYDNLGSMLDELKRSLELLAVPLGEAIIPLISTLVECIQPLVTIIGDSLTPLFEQLQEFLIALEEPLNIIFEVAGEILEVLVNLVTTALTPVLDVLTQLLEPITSLVEGLLTPLAEMFQALLEPLETLINSALQPVLDLVTELLDPISELVNALLLPLQDLFAELTPVLEDLFSALTPVFDLLGEIGNLISKTLGPIISILSDNISNMLGNAIDSVVPIIESLMDVLDGVIKFVTGVFTGNWEQAWEGIVNVFKGYFNYIPSIVEAVLNGAISTINGLINGINNITGAIGIPSIPLIPEVSLPRFHAGGIVDFKTGEGPALLSDGEMVLTPRQQAALFSFINNPISSSGELGGSAPVVIQNETPVYLDGKLISKNSTQHQFTDAMIRRVR